MHWPVADTYIRRQGFRTGDAILEVLAAAGYHAEPDVIDPVNSVVVAFPTQGPQVRTEREVSVWEKVALAALTQRWWADNQVSVTATFQEHERAEIAPVLRAFDGQLKSISFLPLREVGGAYAQMPYERISNEDFDTLTSNVRPIDWAALYDGEAVSEAEGEKFLHALAGLGATGSGPARR